MQNITSPRPVTDETIEAEIQRKGLTAPRIKPEDLEAAIASAAFHVFPGSQLTVCCLTLHNGFYYYRGIRLRKPGEFQRRTR